MSKYYNDKFLVLGDYNLTNVNWVSNNRKIIPRLSNNNLYETNIISALSYVNLMQNNLIHNSSGSLLDLVFSNIVNVNVSSEASPLVPLDYKFHPALKITLPLSSTKENLYYNEIVHDFISCDYNAIRSCMASTDWSCTFKDLHINEALDIFYSKLHDIIDIHCQKKRMFSSKYPLWFSKTLKQLIFSKKVAHKIYKQTPTNVNYNIFSNLRAQCKFVNKTDYGNFIQRTQSSIASNPKRFWNYINSKRSNSNIPSVISYNNQTVTGGDKIAESFANYYSTIYKQLNFMQKPPDDIKSMKVDLNTCVITLSDIYDELSTLKSTTCPGPDNIPYAFFTNCKCVLSIPLLYLFNMSLNSGVFPDKWKISYIKPIPKGGDITLVTNYRPISIISIIPKLFESIVHKKIFPLFKNIISDVQHGFMPGKSTTTNLLVLQNYILQAFRTGLQVDVIYTDFSKAFDKVDHCALSTKLFNLGIRNPFHSWLVSFITGRQQYVKCTSFNSSLFKINTGVPQGSHLAPLLFNLFINDIKFLNSNTLLYADDMKIYRIITSPADNLLLQDDLNRLSTWCTQNNLSLNINKCKIITFSKNRTPTLYNYYINNIKLDRVYLYKDLGIYFDPSLSFNDHYIYIQNKASSMLGFINRSCKDFVNPLALKSLYCSFVRSLLDYGSIVWSSQSIGATKSMESIQNRFLRIIQFRLCIERVPHSSYQPLLSYLKLETLVNRRKRLDLCFIFKLTNGYINCPELLSLLNFNIPNRRTRQLSTFYVQLQRSNYGLNAPMNRSMQLVNYLNVDLFSCVSLKDFNSYLNNILAV